MKIDPELHHDEMMTVGELKGILNNCNDDESIYYYDSCWETLTKPRVGRWVGEGNSWLLALASDKQTFPHDKNKDQELEYDYYKDDSWTL